MNSIEEFDFLKRQEPEVQFEIVDIRNIVGEQRDIAVQKKIKFLSDPFILKKLQQSTL